VGVVLSGRGPLSTEENRTRLSIFYTVFQRACPRALGQSTIDNTGILGAHAMRAAIMHAVGRCASQMVPSRVGKPILFLHASQEELLPAASILVVVRRELRI
jgi:hypothetical protein